MPFLSNVKNNVEPGGPHMKILRMYIAGWIPKVTNTHSEYAMRIASMLQQRLHLRASMLRHIYIVCLARFQAAVGK